MTKQAQNEIIIINTPRTDINARHRAPEKKLQPHQIQERRVEVEFVTYNPGCNPIYLEHEIVCTQSVKPLALIWTVCDSLNSIQCSVFKSSDPAKIIKQALCAGDCGKSVGSAHGERRKSVKHPFTFLNRCKNSSGQQSEGRSLKNAGVKYVCLGGKKCSRCHGCIVLMQNNKSKKTTDEQALLVCSRCFNEDTSCLSSMNSEVTTSVVHSSLGTDHHNSKGRYSFLKKPTANVVAARAEYLALPDRHVVPTLNESHEVYGQSTARRSVANRIRPIRSIKQMFNFVTSPFKSDETKRSGSLVTRDTLRSVAQRLDTMASAKSSSTRSSLERGLDRVATHSTRGNHVGDVDVKERYIDSRLQSTAWSRNYPNSPTDTSRTRHPRHAEVKSSTTPVYVTNGYWEGARHSRKSPVHGFRAVNSNLTRSFKVSDTLLSALETPTPNSRSPVRGSPTNDRIYGSSNVNRRSFESKLWQQERSCNDFSAPMIGIPYDEASSCMEEARSKNLVAILKLVNLITESSVLIQNVTSLLDEKWSNRSDERSLSGHVISSDLRVHEALKEHTLFQKTLKTSKRATNASEQSDKRPRSSFAMHPQYGPNIVSNVKHKSPIISVHHSPIAMTLPKGDQFQEAGTSIQLHRLKPKAIRKLPRKSSDDRWNTSRTCVVIRHGVGSVADSWPPVDEVQKSYAQLSACLRPVPDTMPYLCKDMIPVLTGELRMGHPEENANEHHDTEVLLIGESDFHGTETIRSFEDLNREMTSSEYLVADGQSATRFTNQGSSNLHKASATTTFISEVNAVAPVPPCDTPISLYKHLTTEVHLDADFLDQCLNFDTSSLTLNDTKKPPDSQQDRVKGLVGGIVRNCTSKSSSELLTLNMGSTRTQNHLPASLNAEKQYEQCDHAKIVNDCVRPHDLAMHQDISSIPTLSSEGRDYFHDYRFSQETTDSTSQFAHSNRLIGLNENAHFPVTAPQSLGGLKARLVVDAEITATLKGLGSLDLRFAYDNGEAQSKLEEPIHLKPLSTGTEQTLTVPTRSSSLSYHVSMGTEHRDRTQRVPEHSDRSLPTNDPFFSPGHYDDHARVSHRTQASDQTRVSTIDTSVPALNTDTHKEPELLYVPNTRLSTKLVLGTSTEGCLQLLTPLTTSVDVNYRTFENDQLLHSCLGDKRLNTRESRINQTDRLDQSVARQNDVVAGDVGTVPMFRGLHATIACDFDQVKGENICTVKLSSAACSDPTTFFPGRAVQQGPRLATIESSSDTFSFPSLVSSRSGQLATTDSNVVNEEGHGKLAIAELAKHPVAYSNESVVCESAETSKFINIKYCENASQSSKHHEHSQESKVQNMSTQRKTSRTVQLSSNWAKSTNGKEKDVRFPGDISEATDTVSTKTPRQWLGPLVQFEPTLSDLQSPLVEDSSVIDSGENTKRACSQDLDDNSTMRISPAEIPEVREDDEPRRDPRDDSKDRLIVHERRDSNVTDSNYITIRCIDSDLSGRSCSLPVLPSPIGPVDYLKQYKKLGSVDDSNNTSSTVFPPSDTWSNTTGETDRLTPDGFHHCSIPLSYCPYCSQPFRLSPRRFDSAGKRSGICRNRGVPRRTTETVHTLRTPLTHRHAGRPNWSSLLDLHVPSPNIARRVRR